MVRSCDAFSSSEFAAARLLRAPRFSTSVPDSSAWPANSTPDNPAAQAKRCAVARRRPSLDCRERSPSSPSSGSFNSAKVVNNCTRRSEEAPLASNIALAAGRSSRTFKRCMALARTVISLEEPDAAKASACEERAWAAGAGSRGG